MTEFEKTGLNGELLRAIAELGFEKPMPIQEKVIPLLLEGFKYPTLDSIIFIMALILLPTIGGFFFTTKAVKNGEASKVQIIETSDPLFATLFAFIVFGESLQAFGYIGAGMIIFGLILSMKNPKQLLH